MSASSCHPGGNGRANVDEKESMQSADEYESAGKTLTLAFGDRGYHIVNRPNPIPEGHKCEKQKGLY